MVLSFACVCALASTRAQGEPDNAKDTLSAKDVTKYFAPYAPDVRACYLANAKSKQATGALRLELIIYRNGFVSQFGFAAPGVVAPWLPRLDDCLRALAKTWHFPMRKYYTSAVIPFVFLKTNAPGAGPLESCWDPRGCPPGVSKGKP